MAHSQETLAACNPATKSSAARFLHISRRTVQRYCDLHKRMSLRSPELPPLVDEKGMVDVAFLALFIEARKRANGRGFPLHRKRFHAQTRFEMVAGPDGRAGWTRLPRRKARTFGRSFEDRLELIKREIETMTDHEQSILIGKSPEVFLEMFRPEARLIAENYKKLRASWERGDAPTVTSIPPRPRH